MFPLIILAAIVGGFFLLRPKPPVLANNAVNKTLRPTDLFAPGFVAILSTIPKDEQVRLIGSGMIVNPSAPNIRYVIVSRANNQSGLVNVDDLTAA